jgi:DNA-3-methyladenine glycosylase II
MPRISRSAATDEVARRDPKMAAVIDRVGPMKLRPGNPDGPFGALARSIVFQQLAGKAAAAIHGRFRALVDGPLTPAAVLALSDEQMRGAGLSNAKMLSIRDLAAKVADGTVILDGVSRLRDNDIVDRLVTVRGIGRWTAEMFLLFELKRLNVWPVDDLGVRNGYGLIQGLTTPPTAKELGPLGDLYEPYRSIAAWYCWQAVHLSRGELP